MSRIAVLGLGNFGTALTRSWLEAGHEVKAWTVEQEVFDAIRATSINEKYLPGVTLQGLAVSMDVAPTMENADYVVLALPSGVVLEVAKQVVPLLEEGQVLVDLAKGLAPGDRLISAAIDELLVAAGKRNPLCVIMGPTIAPEVAAGVLTVAMVACTERATAEGAARTLSTPTFRLSAADDPVGAEYWGAFKNVIALACGVSDGLKANGRGGGDNLKAAIFTAGYREAVALLPRLGAAPQTATSAAGIGDLFVTASSPHGRNRQMGERLGRGQSLAQAEGEMVMVSEGVRAARMFQALFAGASIEAPFVDSVCAFLDGGIDVDGFLAAVLGGSDQTN